MRIALRQEIWMIFYGIAGDLKVSSFGELKLVFCPKNQSVRFRWKQSPSAGLFLNNNWPARGNIFCLETYYIGLKLVFEIIFKKFKLKSMNLFHAEWFVHRFPYGSMVVYLEPVLCSISRNGILSVQGTNDSSTFGKLTKGKEKQLSKMLILSYYMVVHSQTSEKW